MNLPRPVQRFLFCSLLAALAAGMHAATAWRSVAIHGGGFVSGLLFHPAVSGLIYARTDVGGAYRWDEANHQWIALNDDIGGLNNEFMHLGVLSFAIDPNDAGRLYLACGQYTWNASWNPNCIILGSTDRGATWTRTTLSIKAGGNEDGRNTGERLQVDPNNGSILFFGSNQDGLWRSADHGATWAQVTGFPATSCTLVLFDKSAVAANVTQTIYVGVNSTTSPSLYRSTDGGTTWSAVTGQPTGLMPHHADIAYASGGSRTLYLACSNALGPNGATNGAVWKMDVTSGNWTNATPIPGPQSWGWGGISVAASDPNIVVASTIDRWGPHDEIYRSTDGGATWRGILQSGTLDTTSAPWAAASTPHWTADVKIDPFTATRALFVTGYGLFASDNAAANTPVWEFRDVGLEETVPNMFVSPPSGPPLVSVVGDVDGFRHDNLGIAPATRHVPSKGSNSSIDLAGTNPAVMARTFDTAPLGAWSADGGASWTLFGSAPAATGTGAKIAVSADGGRFVWAQSGSATSYSINHGTTWAASAGVPSGFAPVADRVNGSKFFVYDSSAGRIYVSTDAGATFVGAASVPTGAAPMLAVPGLEGHLWLPCWGSGLRRSTDSGASFTIMGSVQEGYAVGFGMPAAGQTYPAVFIWGKIAGVVGLYRSDDTGATWTRINDDQHQFGYINWMSGDPRVFGRVYLATSGRGIIYGEASIAPTIVSQPSGQTVRAGQNVTFAVVAGGAPAPAFQWQSSTDAGAHWADLSDNTVYSGSATNTLTVNAVTDAMSGVSFHCVITNSVSSVTTQPVFLVVATPLVVTTLAGQAGLSGTADGTGAAARFNTPADLAADGSGNLFVADTNNSVIRKITPAGVVTTVAGLTGVTGSTDGTGSAARFSHPTGISADAAGNLYVADTDANTVRRVTAAGLVSTVAGVAGSAGSADGTGSAARFNSPADVAADSAGNLYVSDSLNHTIRKIAPAGAVSTVAGLAGARGSADGTGSAARFFAPEGIAIDSAGNVYVADTDNHTIRKIAPNSAVTTLAGLAGISGQSDASGSSARFYYPADVTVDAGGNLFVADTDNHTIRKISSSGVVATVAGLAGSTGIADGTGGAARFLLPTGVATDASGNVYVADTSNHTIRKAAPLAAPTIQTQPQSQTVTAGTTVSFSVVATGAPAPTYQWAFNGIAIAGATADTLMLNSVQSNAAGNYTVTVTNSVRSVTSNTATLTVNAATPPPSGGGGGGGGGDGGGGGAPSLGFWGALILIAGARRISRGHGVKGAAYP